MTGDCIILFHIRIKAYISKLSNSKVMFYILHYLIIITHVSKKHLQKNWKGISNAINDECLCSNGKDLLFIIGGLDVNKKSYVNAFWIYNISSGNFTKGPSLQVGKGRMTCQVATKEGKPHMAHILCKRAIYFLYFLRVFAWQFAKKGTQENVHSRVRFAKNVPYIYFWREFQ